MRHPIPSRSGSTACRLLTALLLAAPLAIGCSGTPTENPDGVTAVQGRRVAPRTTMNQARGFVRLERSTEEHTDQLFNGLGIVPGMTACEVGAGNGYFTLELGRLVYPGGKVIATDILPEMLEALAAREAETRRVGDQLAPIQRVGGQPDDPALPEGGCDIILVAHAYHEFDRPEAMLSGISRALAPDGRLVFVEYRAEKPPPKAEPLRSISKTQLHREIDSRGFKLIGQIDSLPWQHVLIYGNADSPRLGVTLRPWQPKFSTIEDDGLAPPAPLVPKRWDGEDE